MPELLQTPAVRLGLVSESCPRAAWAQACRDGLCEMSVQENLEVVRERIAQACLRAGRDPDEITLVAVTKTVGPDRIQEAVDAGVAVLGENRVQEAEGKIGAVRGEIAWHMVGHLQRNKARKAVEMFDMIQSVDSIRLGEEVSRRGVEAGRSMDILVEVNTSGEETKYGIRPEYALDLAGKLSELPSLCVKGLMTIGTFTDDEGVIRECFKNLRGLAEEAGRAGIPGVEMRYLSMGMTSDFELAIEEGSNMVRIGTAIFGPR
jgi:pyridoxal phosphate enzyme (YggS family)